MGEPLKASDTISVFDAALLWFRKDSREELSGYGSHGWIVLLTRDTDVHALARTLLFEISSGRLDATRKAYLAGIAESWIKRLASPGDLDPRGTMLAASVLAKFASGQGQKPSFIAHLMSDPESHSGGPGKPSSMHLVEAELERRASSGQLESTATAEANALAKWLKENHPNNAPATAKTIRNRLAARYRELAAARRPE